MRTETPSARKRKDPREFFRVKTWADRPPRVTAEGGKNLCEFWNQLCPVGTEVRFYGWWGRWLDFEDTKTRGEAFMSLSGDPVLFIEGRPGYVSLFYCEPLLDKPPPSRG